MQSVGVAGSGLEADGTGPRVAVSVYSSHTSTTSVVVSLLPGCAGVVVASSPQAVQYKATSRAAANRARLRDVDAVLPECTCAG